MKILTTSLILKKKKNNKRQLKMKKGKLFKSIFEAAGLKGKDTKKQYSKTSNQQISLTQIAGPYLNWYSKPVLSIDLNKATESNLIKNLGVSKKIAKQILQHRKANSFHDLDDFLKIKNVRKKILLKNRFQVITKNSNHPHITNLKLTGLKKYVLSNSPYELQVEFTNSSNNAVKFIQITVFWEGEPYIIQKLVSKEEATKGKKIIQFGKEDFLTVGPVRFQVKIFDSDGDYAESGIGTYVLPNNPLQVRLTPGDSHYRSWIVRSELIISNRSFRTRIDWTVSNTTGNTRRFSGFQWIATDGGSHVETISSNLSFTVGSNGTSSFRTTLTSPENSPIGRLLNRGGDYTLKIRLVDDRGVTIEDTIVVQPWLGYNLNIIRVGNLQSGDRTGLRNMANHASSIYQQINLTMNRLENNWRVTGNVSAWDVVDSNEVDDLFQYASVNNDGLDLFIVRDYTGGTGASFEPGDCQKGGNRDGIIMDRRYDGSGNLYWRGMGQTLAHESGHYFGLPHTPNNATNDFRVMHPSFREDRTVFVWDEYYDAYDHCFIYLIY